MEIARGEIWWAELPEPVEASPGGRGPVLVIQPNAFNRSRISTILAAVVTSDVRLAELPGNLLLQARESGLRRPSVVNVSQIVTADRSFLTSHAGKLRPESMARVDQGLRLLLNLA